MDIHCSHYGTQAPKKLPVRRRSWTPLEEKCLMVAFGEIIQQGWKVESGFKIGFLMQLEQKMRAALPGTDLRGDPHINSKYGTWKKIFKKIWITLNNSGFNWNSVTCTVVAPPEVWDEWLKAHPSLKDVREKSFPFYESWVEIFGQNHAFGGNSKNILGNKRSQAPRQEQKDAYYETEYNQADTTAAEKEGVVQSETGQKERAHTPSATDSKKRKRMDGVEELIDCMNYNWAKATESIDKLAARMGHDMDEASARKNLTKVIAELPLMIDRAQRLKACLVIGHDQETLDMFYGFDEEDKCDVVKMAINGLPLK